ncbi:MAG: hypothetical protein UY92_C0011G0025 [Candidatus Magasanikbacteria bacterium GW2011_GWA2_56_11]|uniref:Aspartate/glutamate/uridylate kinase domain-containing protein n=1 Tax=Candidatus Magasanikbacteria bacterium GW2011_GWA2_56_11 TaxID=1619044 RepID=A0A0G1YEV2_9BACT|nr:MAG: hypothetical protein UY92_C0011G0025 [Candidatus Magasanikbacteria bacterium GW2011_GWA2_56_11]
MPSIPKILSVGGSIIIPKTGFDIAFLKRFRALILSRVKKGERFVLVTGGGATCRQYQEAAAQVRKLTPDDLDWMGIYTTIYNAQFVRLLFKEYAYPEIITNPHRKVNTAKPIIMAAGEKPGASSDIDAVELAHTYGAKEVFNLSNVEYVYDRDPNKYHDAVRIEAIDWASFRRDIVGTKWVPGFNAPFDPTASAKAQKYGLKVSIVRGTDLPEVAKALRGRKFRGTVIS